MTAKYILGEATIEDIDQLVELRLAYIKEDMGEMTEEETANVVDQLHSYFERKLGKEIVAYVARENEKIVSVALLHIIEMPANPNAFTGLLGEVLNVYTMPENRGRGLCTSLIKMLLDGAKARNLSRVDLSATRAGYPVYKCVGFKEKNSHYIEMRYII